ncbi:Lrp/AsnC family transcriptional regulator [Flagellimonas sp.]|uniref:Lrp/AsnC family transcriptional regulator n=1 Tax=Flagellimonas sp. TaxID=2058762 RepID=UPI003F4A34FB
MDAQDESLLTLLQTDSKRTNKELANHLGLSTTAVFERIKRLERKGVIKGYVALVDRKKVNRSFMVLCHVKLIQHTKDNVLQFEREVQKLEEVSECFHTSGDYDYMLKISVADMDAYRQFMVTKLTAIKNIGSTQSAFVIKEVKNSTAILLQTLT